MKSMLERKEEKEAGMLTESTEGSCDMICTKLTMILTLGDGVGVRGQGLRVRSWRVKGWGRGGTPWISSAFLESTISPRVGSS